MREAREVKEAKEEGEGMEGTDIEEEREEAGRKKGEGEEERGGEEERSETHQEEEEEEEEEELGATGAEEEKESYFYRHLSHLSSYDGENDDALDVGISDISLKLKTTFSPSSSPSQSSPSSLTSSSVHSKKHENPQISSHSSSPPQGLDLTFDPSRVPPDVRERVLSEFRSILGGRETLVVTGGAPTSQPVRAFISKCFGRFFAEGYGATEVGMGCVCVCVYEMSLTICLSV